MSACNVKDHRRRSGASVLSSEFIMVVLCSTANAFITSLAPFGRCFFPFLGRGGTAHCLRIPGSFGLRRNAVLAARRYAFCVHPSLPHEIASSTSTRSNPVALTSWTASWTFCTNAVSSSLPPSMPTSSSPSSSSPASASSKAFPSSSASQTISSSPSELSSSESLSWGRDSFAVMSRVSKRSPTSSSESGKFSNIFKEGMRLGDTS